MTDYYALDAWPYDIADFRGAYDEVAKSMAEIHGFELDDPHLVLRGDIAERQSSLHICPMCAWWTAVDSAVLPAARCQFWLDAVLRGRAGERIGVQVKRRGRSIEIGQIRAFLGALMLGGYARGVFVSTTGFQRGAVRAAKSCRKWAAVELVDADQFFGPLGVAQLNADVEPETCGFYECSKPATSCIRRFI